jgi:hypothetical protein
MSRGRSGWTCAVGVALLVGVLAAPAPAGAAQLVGGREQTTIARAFHGSRARRRLLIVSERVSTVAPAWAVVRSVAPQGTGRTTSRATPIRIQSAYFHRIGGRERPARPPAAVRADLGRPLSVAIVYAGSGSETVTYQQSSRSVCPGAGGFIDRETVTVAPMTWTVRYVVNLDDLHVAVRGAPGTVLVPGAYVDRAASRLDVTENAARTFVDAGCNGRAAAFRCVTRFGLSPAGVLSFSPALEVGLPVTIASATGSCDPVVYALGPSLFDGGATTALVAPLGLLGGHLPANPYAPVTVSWPADSASLLSGFLASPCAGDAAACQDAMQWHGTVTIQPVG